MKLRTKILIIFYWTIFVSNSLANPIIVSYLNEIEVNSSGWIIEIMPQSLILDNCYLVSTTDTAYFKSGINWNQDYLIITEDSLLSPLYMNPLGDVIYLCGEYGPIDGIRFGNVSAPMISAPLGGLSICRYNDFDEYFLYLDSSPTLGSANDTTNGMGKIEGWVEDTLGNPIEGVDVIYNYDEGVGSTIYPVYVTSDSNGYFRFRDYAKLEHLEFEKENFQTKYLTIQNWPDSTVSITATIDSILSSIKEQGIAKSNFQLYPNFPNPFNPTTTISYQLAKGSEIELIIYNLLGQKIRTLVNARQPLGFHQVEWDGHDEMGVEVTSGIYFYRLKAGEFVANKKMILLK